MLTHATVEESQKLEAVRSRLMEGQRSRGSLIPILQTIQKEMGYLPAEALDLVAGLLNISAGEVYGVASFYNQFRFNPPGKHQIKVCLGTACHVRGGDIILENFERKLDIKEGHTTEDREFSLERVACVGCCALAPVVLMNEKTHGYMSPSKVEGLFTQLEIAKKKSESNKTDGSE
ncbi:MAG: NADH-quinone oxidoreductase subunit NuoE [Thermodesulfobacteriota bacterium]